jgi:hypothetical protein
LFLTLVDQRLVLEIRVHINLDFAFRHYGLFG